MFGTAFTTLTGLLDKRFTLNALAPTLLGALISVLIWQATGDGLGAGIDELKKVSGVTASIVAIVCVGVVTVAAVLLSSQASRLASWYAGYSGPLSGRLGQPGRDYWRRRQAEWQGRFDAHDTRWPRDAWLSVPLHGDVSPTALGTMGQATACHLMLRFGIAVDRTWPLLSTQISGDALERIEAAESSIEQMLALTTVSALTGIVGAFVAASHRTAWFVSPGIAAAGFVLAFVFYRASLAPTRAWSDMVRSAFELHRLDLLDALQVPRPVNSTQERALWQRLDSVLLARDDRAYALATTKKPADGT